MKRTLAFSAVVLTALVAGIGVGIYLSPGNEAGMATTSGEPEILYWVAPMDPDFRRDGPGKSPMGMDLVPVYAEENGTGDSDIVSIDPSIINNLGVRVAAAERGALPRRIETVGYVSYDEDTILHVHTRVDGWIERLGVSAAGDQVKRGDVLFEVYSPTLVNAQEEFLAAHTSAAKGLAAASRQRLLSLGMRESEIDQLARERRVRQRMPVVAQTDGVISQLGVREGIYVTPATDIMSIAELDKVWVLADVYERQVAWVRQGQRADVELDYLPGKRWQGEVDHVYPELDEKTRTLKLRLRFDNSDQMLRPNMYTRVTIFGSETGSVVHIPRAALIRGGKVDRVVVSLGDGRFRAQPVETGIESGDRIEIRRGINVGESVVTSGQFLIDSESNIDRALERFESGEKSDIPMPTSGEVDDTQPGPATGKEPMNHSEMGHGHSDHDEGQGQ